MAKICHTPECHHVIHAHETFCSECDEKQAKPKTLAENLAHLYPKYYKSVGELTEVDVYAIHHLFNIEDPAGCIHHSSKKLLLSGVRTGGKSKYQDIKEARDTLNRWLQLNPETP